MINTKAIQERAKQLGISQRDMAEAIGCAQPTVSQKINNKRPMDLGEAEKLQQLLGIENKEFASYFLLA